MGIGPFQPIFAFSCIFAPIFAYSNIFQPIPAYYILFKHIPVQSNLYRPISAYFTLFQLIPANSSLWQHIPAYFLIPNLQSPISNVKCPIVHFIPNWTFCLLVLYWKSHCVNVTDKDKVERVFYNVFINKPLGLSAR